MTRYDFSPLFRNSVGFDRLADLVDVAMQTNGSANGYPPYDILTDGEDKYRINMAVAGFAEKDLSIEVDDRVLTVSGNMTPSDDDAEYLHRGIAERNFVRKFHLADYVNVVDAHLDNGLLSINLVREVPEEMKPRTIKIENDAPKSLTDKAKKLIEGSTKRAA